MSELNDLEEQRKGFEEAISFRDQALRLSKNKDFKSLIMKHFMVDECARYVHTSVNMALSPEDRSNALAIAQSASYLKQFLSAVIAMGNAADSQMDRLDDAISEERSLENAGPDFDEGDE